MTRLSFFAGLVAALAPAYLLRFSLLGIPTTVLELAIYAFVVAVIVTGRRKIEWLPRTPLARPVILLLAAALLSTIVAPDLRSAAGILKGWIIDPILFVWALWQLPDRQKVSAVVAGGLITGGALVALTALWQRLTGNLTPDGRAVGLYSWFAANASPNYLALYLAPLGVLAAGAAAALFFDNRHSPRWLWLASAAILIILALVFSFSRAGLAALGLGIAIKDVLRFWPWIKVRAWAKTTVILIFLTAAAGAWWFIQPNPSLTPEEGGRITASNNVRWEIWRTSAREIIPPHTFFGVGLGNFQASFTELTRGRVNYDRIAPLALTPHNLLLSVWTNLGLPGLLAFLWIAGLTVQEGWRALLLAGQSPAAWQAATWLGAFGALLLHGLVDTPYFKNDLSLLFWILVAMPFFFTAPASPRKRV